MAKNKLYKTKEVCFKIIEVSSDSILFRSNIYKIKDGLTYESLLERPAYVIDHKGQELVSGYLSEDNIFSKMKSSLQLIP